jgi:hypothetical protein
VHLAEGGVSERYIDIPNWDKFQHKDIWRKSGGRPPWIKAYTRLLSNNEWLDLSQSQQGILVNLWLMYASAGQSVSEAGAKRRLCRSDAEARWWRSNLEALRDAGFIEILSQPISAPVAPRVEERREELPSIPSTAERPAQPTEAEIVKAREDRQRNGYVEGLSSYTGCRIVRGEVGIHHVYDPLGTEPLPAYWPYPRPTRDEIRAALKERSVA